jgi:hypothetical protein
VLDGVLEELGTVRKERDSARQELATLKQTFAHTRLKWLAERLRINTELRRKEDPNQPAISVTVRFASYDDYEIAQRLEAILKEHTGWPITLVNHTNPAMRPDKRFKVIFESGLFGTFDEAAWAFTEGNLLECEVGRRSADRVDHEHLIIEVLPSAPQKSEAQMSVNLNRARF